MSTNIDNIMMYCNALGFMPAFAILVQNVCRMVCGVITSGNGSLWHLLYFLARHLNMAS